MIRNLASRSHLVMLVLTSILFLYGIVPASAATDYKPGVKPGDSATYGQVSATWKSNVDPSSPVRDFLNATKMTISILNVKGTEVTARQIYTYANGTTVSRVWVENVQTGANNVSTAIAWIIAGSLVAPDTIYGSSSAETIEQTVRGFYAGSARTVNLMNSTQPRPGGFCKFLRIWDQNSGVLIGFALNYSVSNTNYHVSASASAWISSTNLWGKMERTPDSPGAPILGLTMFSAIVGMTSADAIHKRRRASRFQTVS